MPRRPLVGLAASQVRFALEQTLADALTAIPGFAQHRRALVPKHPDQARRRLLATSLRMSESMAPAAFRQAHEAKRVLAIEGDLEIYQSSGQENAALHLVETPILVEIQGRMLSLLDEDAGIALFGHELGHYLAHGPWNDLGATALAGAALAEHGLLAPKDLETARQLLVAREITADRLALLAVQDLDAVLRLEMVATTGLSGEALTWDTTAYLNQCRELMDRTLAEGDTALSTTHPEHSLRAWAAWLFFESDRYHELTGQGVGTRKIAEVDALVATALGAAVGSDPTDLRGEPPGFLSECALASAVLVARADGEFAREELDAIEDAFGTSVPGWSEFLDPDVALERFYETGHLVASGGPDLARTLFLLIAHVMGADDVVDAREVQMVLAIGEALGFAAEFRDWIKPAVEAMGGTLEVEVDETVAVPLPVRRDEVRDALEAFCASVLRQGETRIAPRRLLRLMGAAHEDRGALERIAKLFEDKGIESHPAIDKARLDDLVLLRAPPQKEPPPPAVELQGSRKALLSAVTRLRDELISGDGRSPAVRLRQTRRGRVFDLFKLDQIRTGAAERTVAMLTGGKKARLVTAEDAGRHDGAKLCAQDLRELDRAHRDRREETGANDLYVGYPVVVGNVAPRGARSSGYGVRAPLVLYPATLDRDGRGARGFTLSPRKDEDPIANQSLLRLLFNKADLAFPDEFSRELDNIAADPALGVQALLKKLGEVGVQIRREGDTLGAFKERNADLDKARPFLALEQCALLGLFQQSNSDLLQDYDGLLRELADPARPLHDVLAAATGLLPPELQGEFPEATDDTSPGWPVLAADPSQRAVAAECRRNLVTVVDGPPGTGKSQLIVNLVADALRRGERVAVVAEKRAALDVVYQRLHGCHLSDSIALVHDVNDDRKPLFRQLNERLTDFKPRSFDDKRLEVLLRDYGQHEKSLEARREVLGHKKPGVDLTVGQLLALQAGGPATIESLELADLDRRQLDELLELAERLHAYQDLWAPASWWRVQAKERPRQGMHEADDARLAAYAKDLQGAIEDARAYETSTRDARVERDQLLTARDGLAAAAQTVEDRDSDGDARIFVALCERPDHNVAEVASLWAEHSTALRQWSAPTTMAVDDALTRSLAIMQSFAGRFGRFFSLVWWRARGATRRALAVAWPERAAAGLDAGFLAEVRARISATHAWEASKALYASLDVADLAPKHADAGKESLERLVGASERVRTMAAHARPLADIGVAIPSDRGGLAGFDARCADRQHQLQALDKLCEQTTKLGPSFPWTSEASREELETLAGRLAYDGHRLREADGWLEQLDSLHPQGRTILDRIAAADPGASASEWREAIARGWAWAQLQRLSDVVPELRELGSAAEDQRAQQASEKMRTLELEIRELQTLRLAATLDDAELLRIPAAEYRARRTDKQKAKERLLKEIRKKRNVMHLRRFVREFADTGVLDALPCWLVSPETMAVLFPAMPLFDLVIFDEASQCTVQSGFPVALRARRVVIAGDEKQMPPTSFFALGQDSTEDEDRSDSELQARDAFASESLLSLARTRCPHAGLKWHYRCHEEELIAFSNHSMYDGELLTIPSTTGPESTPALRWVHVEDGAYDRGLNRPEAERVVTLIHELLETDPSKTIGVVTFNIQQRQTILDAIDMRCGNDDTFGKLWSQANATTVLDQRPFVKNLEGVQGDERDIIVFSLGHAPIERQRKGGDKELYVPARFGPLGQRGGERRLNVAISRAKSACYVVSSFDPKLLHVGSATHDGPRLFKGFLTYAHDLAHGRRAQAERVLDEVRGRRRKAKLGPLRALVDGHVPLAAQICLALEEDGLRCELGVGTSDFRIPLVVGRKDERNYCLAVLTDEGDRGASVFDQYIHQPAVLMLRGWTVLQVTAASWARRRTDVLAEIARALEDGRPAVSSAPEPGATSAGPEGASRGATAGEEAAPA